MKKPDIYKPNINVNNNRKVYYSFLNNSEKENETPIEFIDNLSKNGEYMFSKKVIIKTKEKEYETRIAGKIGNKIITLDNDSININDIEKIYEK